MACMGASISLVFGETNLMNWHKDLSLRERERALPWEWDWLRMTHQVTTTVTNCCQHSNFVAIFCNFWDKKEEQNQYLPNCEASGYTKKKKRFISKKCMEDVIYL